MSAENNNSPDPAEATPTAPEADPAETTPAAPEPAPESPNPEESPEPESPDSPEANSAPAQPKLSAFERGKLRALGMGGLINRLEISEGQLSAALAENKALKAENARLKAGSEAERQAAQKKIEAAQKGRENEVSMGVRQKLSDLGVPEAAAPGVIVEEQGQTLTRAEFEKLDFTARNQFIRNNGKIV